MSGLKVGDWRDLPCRPPGNEPPRRGQACADAGVGMSSEGWTVGLEPGVAGRRQCPAPLPRPSPSKPSLGLTAAAGPPATTLT